MLWICYLLSIIPKTSLKGSFYTGIRETRGCCNYSYENLLNINHDQRKLTTNSWNKTPEPPINMWRTRILRPALGGFHECRLSVTWPDLKHFQVIVTDLSANQSPSSVPSCLLYSPVRRRCPRVENPAVNRRRCSGFGWRRTLHSAWFEVIVFFNFAHWQVCGTHGSEPSPNFN